MLLLVSCGSTRARTRLTCGLSESGSV